MQDTEVFLQTLDSAVRCGMPKLLACCEHHIAADPQQWSQQNSSHQEQLLPISSALRIAQGLRMALHRMAADDAAADQSRRKGNKGVPLSKYVPGPKEFLQMAQQQG